MSHVGKGEGKAETWKKISEKKKPNPGEERHDLANIPGIWKGKNDQLEKYTPLVTGHGQKKPLPRGRCRPSIKTCKGGGMKRKGEEKKGTRVNGE